MTFKDNNTNNKMPLYVCFSSLFGASFETMLFPFLFGIVFLKNSSKEDEPVEADLQAPFIIQVNGATVDFYETLSPSTRESVVIESNDFITIKTNRSVNPEGLQIELGFPATPNGNRKDLLYSYEREHIANILVYFLQYAKAAEDSAKEIICNAWAEKQNALLEYSNNITGFTPMLRRQAEADFPVFKRNLENALETNYSIRQEIGWTPSQLVTWGQLFQESSLPLA